MIFSMSDSLCTKEALDQFSKLKPLARNSLVAFNEQRFSDGQEILSELKVQLDSAKNNTSINSDDYRNDLWVLDRYIDFLSKYGHTWENIVNQRFSDSWLSLQDSLDFLRLIKKFSNIDIHFLEDQLVELERTYPYNVFFSIGLPLNALSAAFAEKILTLRSAYTFEDTFMVESWHMRSPGTSFSSITLQWSPALKISAAWCPTMTKESNST